MYRDSLRMVTTMRNVFTANDLFRIVKQVCHELITLLHSAFGRGLLREKMKIKITITMRVSGYYLPGDRYWKPMFANSCTRTCIKSPYTIRRTNTVSVVYKSNMLRGFINSVVCRKSNWSENNVKPYTLYLQSPWPITNIGCCLFLFP